MTRQPVTDRGVVVSARLVHLTIGLAGAGVFALGSAAAVAAETSLAFDAACANSKSGSLRVLLGGGKCNERETAVRIGSAHPAPAVSVQYVEQTRVSGVLAVDENGNEAQARQVWDVLECPAGTKVVGGSANSSQHYVTTRLDLERNGLSYTWYPDGYYREEAGVMTIQAACIS